jgi:hypothetical protein
LYAPHLSPHPCCMSRPFDYSWFYHPNNTSWRLLIIKLTDM